MPMCHNVVEAMAVGTIPLIDYPEWLHPRLEHLTNCIAFDGKEDLVAKMRLALSMPTSKVAEMRANVAAYYSAYLQPEVAVERIEARPERHAPSCCTPNSIWRRTRQRSIGTRFSCEERSRWGNFDRSAARLTDIGTDTLGHRSGQTGGRGLGRCSSGRCAFASGYSKPIRATSRIGQTIQQSHHPCRVDKESVLARVSDRECVPHAKSIAVSLQDVVEAIGRLEREERPFIVHHE